MINVGDIKMLCGRCKEPLICRDCDGTELQCSQEIYGKHKFRSKECEYCKENPIYIDKDAMWYIKSTLDAIMILIFLSCLIGFILSLLVFFWNKEVSNLMMGFSVCIGLVNILFMISVDDRWREDYIDRSMVFPIKEKINGK